MVMVSNSMPPNIPEQVRADVGQEMVLGLIAGDFTEEQLRQQFRKYLNAHYKAVEFDKFKHLSLDQPVPGTDRMTWFEVLDGSSLNEGRIDHQSAWMLGKSGADQIEETYDQEVRSFAARRLWSLDEARDFLEAEQ